MNEPKENPLTGTLGLPIGMQHKPTVIQNPQNVGSMSDTKPPVILENPIDIKRDILNFVDRLPIDDKNKVRGYIFQRCGEPYPTSMATMADILLDMSKDLARDRHDPELNKKDNKDELLMMLAVFASLYPFHLKEGIDGK